MCSDPGLEAFESQDDLKNELMRRVSRTDLKKNIMNSVYSLLHGLEEIEIPKFDEYVPEEPDWILNGRIKWLKRYFFIFRVSTHKNVIFSLEYLKDSKVYQMS